MKELFLLSKAHEPRSAQWPWPLPQPPRQSCQHVYASASLSDSCISNVFGGQAVRLRAVTEIMLPLGGPMCRVPPFKWPPFLMV